MEVRHALSSDLNAVMDLATAILGPQRAGPVIRSHVERHHLLVANDGDELVGVVAYRTDWFQCTIVSLICVSERHRRRGAARALVKAVEQMSPSPRLYASAEETNAVGIRMLSALGFAPSGYIDNLPQGYRELLFYKRLHP
ncbi:MAG: hypothetical protein DMD91_07385 [Candidatus Rokuibacteriota bacterium]|nr:MAG: hypothetical protein DMD91_07385 [Candidatus Rokubacteria bacterium]